MRIRKLMAVVMTAAMAFTMVACGGTSTSGESSGDTSGETSTETSGTVGFSVSTLNNPFFVTLTDGAEAKAKEAGVELIVVDAGDDAAKQASDIEDLLSKNISVLIVNPVDSDAVAPAVEDAIAQGVKVIAVDRGVNGVEIDLDLCQYFGHKKLNIFSLYDINT
jgi:ribose transport system substrate-binding protein